MLGGGPSGLIGVIGVVALAVDVGGGPSGVVAVGAAVLW